MAQVITEQSIAEMAPNDKALLDARGLVRKGALKKLARNADGTLVFGLCDGSGSSPYAVSMDLAGGDRPTLRCSCPSRQFPCKHELGLMLVYLQRGSSFPVEEPPADLVEKRAKQAAKVAAKAAPEAKPDKAEAAKKKAAAALAKKAKDQSDALDTLETFLVDLVLGGLGGLTDKSIEAIEQQSKRMADADMKRAAGTLTRLAAFLSEESEDEDEDGESEKKAARGLGEEQETRVAWMLTQLYTTVRRGKKALSGKLVEEGTSQSEADAQLESILGRAWKLPELAEAGYWVKERRYVELAHERWDDDITSFATATGYLLDLDDGSIVCDVTSLPYHALPFGKLRASRQGTLLVRDAALYPGDLVNRRVRWDEKGEGVVTERAREAGDYGALHEHARPLEDVLKAMRNQLKNPLHPLDAVFLVAAKRFGLAGKELVLEDAAGMRLILRDPKGARLPSTGALRHAAAAFGPGSLAVRVYFDLQARALYGEPLALFVEGEHLRLRASTT